MTEYVSIIPTFEAATNICILALENGTDEGKAMAKKELLRYAKELDRLKKILKEEENQ